MAIRGVYLVLKLDGEIVAETINVSMKMIVKGLDRTSQDTGLNAAFMSGKVKIGIAGTYLMASDNSNWTTLYGSLNSSFAIGLYLNESMLLNGYGILKKLSLKGSDSKKNLTGTYGIRFNESLDTDVLITESGIELTTEDGQTLIIE